MSVQTVMFSVVLLVGLGMLIGLLLPGSRRRLSATWIREQRVPLTPPLRDEIERSRWRHRLGGMIGALVSLALVILVISRLEMDDRLDPTVMPLLGLLLISLIFAGEGISGLATAVVETRGPVRVAGSRAVRLTDYVAPLGLFLMRAQQLLTIAGAVAAYSLTAGGTSDPRRLVGTVGVVAGVLGAWSISEWAARRLLAQPLSSADPLALFWRSALRGERARRICGLPAAIGVFTTQLVTWLAIDADDTLGLGPILAYLVVSLALMLLAQIALDAEPHSAVHHGVRRAARDAHAHAHA